VILFGGVLTASRPLLGANLLMNNRISKEIDQLMARQEDREERRTSKITEKVFQVKWISPGS